MASFRIDFTALQSFTAARSSSTVSGAQALVNWSPIKSLRPHPTSLAADLTIFLGESTREATCGMCSAQCRRADGARTALAGRRSRAMSSTSDLLQRSFLASALGTTGDDLPKHTVHDALATEYGPAGGLTRRGRHGGNRPISRVQVHGHTPPLTRCVSPVLRVRFRGAPGYRGCGRPSEAETSDATGRAVNHRRYDER